MKKHYLTLSLTEQGFWYLRLEKISLVWKLHAKMLSTKTPAPPHQSQMVRPLITELNLECVLRLLAV